MPRRAFLIAAMLLIGAPVSQGSSPSTNPAGLSIEQKTRALLETWSARLKEEKFNSLVAPPFVIAGDGSPQQLAHYRDATVLAAARALWAQFFKVHPDEPILILLFETEEPYKRLAKAWFNDDDVPHYGLYRHHDRVMLMNVGTGTGTLVHELTHALIAPDFPKVPDWFNEGLASLYEQCSIGNQSIKGLPNWRLPALQKAIRADTLRPLSELTAETDFYNDDRVGLNYAQARYLMLWLQEKGLLQRYYTQFRDHAGDDPTGLKSLKAVIGPQSIEAFEKDWRKWVLTLQFP
jgi:hypothetical protein